MGEFGEWEGSRLGTISGLRNRPYPAADGVLATRNKSFPGDLTGSSARRDSSDILNHTVLGSLAGKLTLV